MKDLEFFGVIIGLIALGLSVELIIKRFWH